MSCSRWDNLEFARFCAEELSQSQLNDLHAHMDRCRDCRDKFILAWNTLTQDSHSREHREDDDAVRRIINSRRWRTYRQEMARRQAESVQASLQAEYLNNHQTIDQLNKLDQPTGSRKFSPRRQSSRAIISAAALVLALIIPVSGLYIYLNRAASTPTNQAANSHQLDNSDPMALAKAFEQADQRLAANPDDSEALFERADKLEKLYLLEAAQADYQQYLKLVSASRREEAKERLALLTSQIETPLKPSPTRYQILDQHINNYLEQLLKNDNAAAAGSLTEAQTLADSMERETGERIGQDLLAYYRHVQPDAIEPLLNARKERVKYETFGIVDNYSNALKDVEQAKIVFENYQAKSDLELTDIQMARFLNKTGNYRQADQIVEKYFSQVVAARHLFSQAQLLLRKGESKGDASQFKESIADFNDAINIAAPLNVPDFSLVPLIFLAGVYYVSNDNDNAFIKANEGLIAASRTNKPSYKIQLCQILGISAFNIKLTSLADNYLNNAILVSQKSGNTAYLATSFSLLGIIKAENEQHAEAAQQFDFAEQALSQIKDEFTRTNISYVITGYHARAAMLNNDAKQAIALYRTSIKLCAQANIQQKLFLSQLHQGLGESLIAAGDKERAESELTIATNFAREARANSEENNALLTFSVTKHDPEFQLQKLKEAR